MATANDDDEAEIESAKSQTSEMDELQMKRCLARLMSLLTNY